MENKENDNGFYPFFKEFTNSFEKYSKLDSVARDFVVEKMTKIEEKTRTSKQYCTTCK